MFWYIFEYHMHPLLDILSFHFLREDTHKKVLFSGRTTKGVGRVNPRDH